MRSSCFSGCGKRRGDVDSKPEAACFPLARSTSKNLHCLRKKLGRGGKKEKKKNGSFSGKIIFSVDSQSVLPEIPSLVLLIISDSEVSFLTLVHAHSPGNFPHGLSSPLRSHLPMTRWPVWRAPSWAGLHTHRFEKGSQCCWAAGITSGLSGCAVCSLSIRIKKLWVEVRH